MTSSEFQIDKDIEHNAKLYQFNKVIELIFSTNNLNYVDYYKNMFIWKNELTEEEQNDDDSVSDSVLYIKSSTDLSLTFNRNTIASIWIGDNNPHYSGNRDFYYNREVDIYECLGIDNSIDIYLTGLSEINDSNRELVKATIKHKVAIYLLNNYSMPLPADSFRIVPSNKSVTEKSSTHALNSAENAFIDSVEIFLNNNNNSVSLNTHAIFDNSYLFNGKLNNLNLNLIKTYKPSIDTLLPEQNLGGLTLP